MADIQQEATALATRLKPQVEQLSSKRVQITSADDLEAAVELVRTQKAMLAAVEDYHAKPKKAAFDAHRFICAQETAMTGPLKAAILANEKLIGTFQREDARRRQEEQQRLQAASDQKFDKRIERQATAMEDRGDETGAQALRDSAAFQKPVVHVPAAAPAPKGVIGPKEEWDFEIVNPDQVPLAWTSPDEKKIKATVKALGRRTEIPGVRIFQKDAKASVR